MIDETVISKAIVTSYFEDLLEHLELDVAIVGAGPSGMLAGYYLAKNDIKVAIFEEKLSIGGGIWGGGMGFNKVVVQEEAREILEELNVSYEEFQEGYYVADAVELATTLGSNVVRSHVKIFNGIGAEDVVMKDGRVTGVVINWTAVKMAGLHVDPLTVKADYVIDSTGHDAEVSNFVAQRVEDFEVPGHGAMFAEKGEKMTVENTKEVYPGLYVTGMAADSVLSSPRMGPIFGGMLLSGRKAARKIIESLKGSERT